MAVLRLEPLQLHLPFGGGSPHTPQVVYLTLHHYSCDITENGMHTWEIRLGLGARASGIRSS